MCGLVCCIAHRVALGGAGGEGDGVDLAQDLFTIGLPDVAPRIFAAGGEEGDDGIGQFARRGKALLRDERRQIAEEPFPPGSSMTRRLA
jgi:hypothetical protein